MRAQNRWIYADLRRLPNDIVRYELWEGELIVTPVPTMRHQEIVRRLMKLFALLDPEDLLGRLYTAPADVKFDDHWVFQPDLFFIPSERLDMIKPRFIDGAPLLCIDILAPHTSAWSATRKRRIYENFGVREYWLVNPFDKTLAIWSRNHDTGKLDLLGEYSGQRIASSQIMEGLSVGIRALFEELPDEPPYDAGELD